jgi:acyl dehydratase
MSEGKSEKLNPSKVIGFTTGIKEWKINPKDTILYALSIGFNKDPLVTKDLNFTYENSEQFSVFPTYASVIPIQDMVDLFNECPDIPDFNFMNLLHGEEWIDILNPLPNSGDLVYQLEFVDLEDKGKGTIFCIGVKIRGKKDQTLYSTITINLFVRGFKGEGVKSNGIIKNGSLKKVPEDKPFKEINFETLPNQALFYRLGGNDLNPLHIDPEMSKLGGFEKPILHGLCTFGMTAKAAFELFCDEKIDNILNYKARFTSHVFPGENLNIKFWKSGSNSVIVSVSTVERKLQVLQGEFIFKGAKL